MKQKKTMLIMVVVLAVLLVLYGGLKAWNSHSDRQKKAKEDKEKVSLVDVKSLKSFAYESGGSKMSFTKENGEWVYDEDDGVRLNQSTIKSTAKEITGLTAIRKLSDPDEKSDYGLDSPDYTVTYTAKDGTKGTIQIGNAAGDNYYAMIEDSDAVYTISGTLTQCADYNVKDLAKYGLDEANRITVTTTYKDSTSGDKKTCTVYVGNVNGDNRYVQLKDSNMVYEVGSSIVENMMSVDK